MNWSRTIKDLRQRRGLKQASLAEILGITQSAVSHWERGADEPTVAMQGRIKDMLFEATPAHDRALQTAIRHSPDSALISPDYHVTALSKFLGETFQGEEGEFLFGTEKWGELHDHRAEMSLGKELFGGEVAAVEFVQRLAVSPVPFRGFCIPHMTTSQGILSQTTMTPISEEEHDAFIRKHGGFMLFHPID